MQTVWFVLQYHVLHCCLHWPQHLLILSHLVLPHCNTRETYSSCHCLQSHSNWKEEESTHIGCGFGWCLRVLQKGSNWAGGELIIREPVALLMSSHNSVAGSDTGAGAQEETESSNWGYLLWHFIMWHFQGPSKNLKLGLAAQRQLACFACHAQER